MKRWLEILPATLAWLTIFLVIFLSWQKPVWVAVFIILFDIYWLLKSIYLSLHLRATFQKMRENLSVSWIAKLSIFANWKKIHHLVILPMVDESYEVIRETFESLKA